MLSEQAAALAAAGVAIVVVVAVVMVLAFVVGRRVPPLANDELSGRSRYPARALERTFVVSLGALSAAALSIWEFDSDVQIGSAAVFCAAGWMWWRGSFLSLRARNPRG